MLTDMSVVPDTASSGKEVMATETEDTVGSLPVTSVTTPDESRPKTYKWDILWLNVSYYIYLHISILHLIYKMLHFQCSIYTCIFYLTVGYGASLGVTAGVHRLWAHRSYKASLFLRILLAFFQTLSVQMSILKWARDHRVHHKYADTDADPSNSKRGFFFSHMGWLLVRRQPEVISKSRTIDISDLLQDPVVTFQHKYYFRLVIIFSILIPTLIPWYFWNESLLVSYYFTLLRMTHIYHSTWLVNSAAHMYGTRPYDKTITSGENRLVSIAAMGEGWHNYHHTFPWDYRASELGHSFPNFTTNFLELCARLGLAYDLKYPSDDLVRKRILRSGDGSRSLEEKSLNLSDHNSDKYNNWGWGDKDEPNFQGVIEMKNGTQNDVRR